MSGTQNYIKNISGGDFSDWVYGTSEYDVPTGYEAYAFVPDSGGATIDTGKWLAGSTNDVETTITATYKSQWIDQSVTVCPIVFYRPVTSITLSAGSGMIYCRRSQVN